MKSMETFFGEITKNKELEAAFDEAVKNGSTEAFLRAQGVDVPPRSHALTDDEVAAASGGAGQGTPPSVVRCPCGGEGSIRHPISDTVANYYCPYCKGTLIVEFTNDTTYSIIQRFFLG